MKKLRGFTLLELVVTIIVLSLAVTGFVLSYTQTILSAANPGIEMKAAQLANARMNIILLQRLVNGYSLIQDPCAGGSPPAACVPLATFATDAGLTAASSIVVGSGITTATVTISGKASDFEQIRFTL